MTTRRYELHDGFLYEDGVKKVNLGTLSVQKQANVLENILKHIQSLSIETFGACRYRTIFKIRGRPYLEISSSGMASVYDLPFYV